MNTKHLPILCLLLSFLPVRSGLSAEGQPATAKVRGILGYAQVSRHDGPFGPLGPGMVVRAGDVVQTATGSALDLQLGDLPGQARLTESTTLLVEKLSFSDPASERPFDVQLTLRSGELVGLLKPLPADSRFEIKVANGVVQVIRGRFRVDARGYVVLVEGKALLAHVPPGGEAVAHTLSAPEAVCFSPVAGVQPAPRALVREVVDQMRSKLPRR